MPDKDVSQGRHDKVRAKGGRYQDTGPGGDAQRRLFFSGSPPTAAVSLSTFRLIFYKSWFCLQPRSLLFSWQGQANLAFDSRCFSSRLLFTRTVCFVLALFSLCCRFVIALISLNFAFALTPSYHHTSHHLISHHHTSHLHTITPHTFTTSHLAPSSIHLSTTPLQGPGSIPVRRHGTRRHGSFFRSRWHRLSLNLCRRRGYPALPWHGWSGRGGRGHDRRTNRSRRYLENCKKLKRSERGGEEGATNMLSGCPSPSLRTLPPNTHYNTHHTFPLLYIHELLTKAHIIAFRATD